jgi:hypothetical protein
MPFILVLLDGLTGTGTGPTLAGAFPATERKRCGFIAALPPTLWGDALFSPCRTTHPGNADCAAQRRASRRCLTTKTATSSASGLFRLLVSVNVAGSILNSLRRTLPRNNVTSTEVGILLRGSNYAAPYLPFAAMRCFVLLYILYSITFTI